MPVNTTRPARKRDTRKPGARKPDIARTMTRARALAAKGRGDDAIAALKSLVKTHPAYMPAWNSLARLQEKAGRKAEARRTRERALAEKVVALCDKAEAAREKNRDEVSRRALEKALALEPECPNAIWWLADYWHEHEDRAKALALYRRYLALEPDDPEAKHMIAALGGSRAPKHAPDNYVRRQFDSYAEDFDKSLIKDLEYQGPELIMRALAAVRPEDAPAADVADLGCGTGLVGKLVRPWARSLAGIDLSPKMIREARKRRVYDRLVVGEITKYLNAHKASFDVITCADVIIYVGDVTQMFRAVAKALRPGGVFAFTAETRHGPGVKLTGSGRYAHNPRWLRRTGKAAGLKEVHAFGDRLRFEKGEPVAGYISVMARPEPAPRGRPRRKR